MAQFSYALVLISVLVGLALGKIASNAHSLLMRRHVAWDARTVLATALIVLTIVSAWFDLWSLRAETRILMFGFYLGLIFVLLVLYFLAASVLPEVAADGRLDDHYQRNATGFWVTFAVFEVSYLALWLSFGGLSLSPVRWAFILMRIGIALALVWRSGRRWHEAGNIALVVLTLLEYGPRSLG